MTCIMSGKYISRNLLRKLIGKSLNQRFFSHDHKNPDVLAKKRQELLSKGLPKRKPITGVKDVILVSSGKGGVGKSTIAVNLAVTMKNLYMDKEIGLLDADIFGPCVALMMNAKDKPFTDEDSKMIPIRNWGIKCISMGQFLDSDKAVVWRGLMVMQALETLLRKVNWGTLDYLIIDTPPGTGDTHLTLIQNIPISAVVLVTTPQRPALEVTGRSIAMFRKMNVNIAGVVENMSQIICPHCGHDSSLYGTETFDFCKDQGLPILASIPLESDISSASDTGKPVVVSKPDSSAAKKFEVLANRVHQYVTDRAVEANSMESNDKS